MPADQRLTDVELQQLQAMYIKPSEPMAGVQNPKAIFLPKTKEDVALAVKASQGEAITFASGFQPAASNDKPGAEGSVVINLAQLDHIEIDKDIVRVGAAAKLGDLVKKLYWNDEKKQSVHLALPVGDNPHQSVISYILRDTPDVVKASEGNLMRVTPSCLQRTLGRLSEHLISTSVVLANGDQHELEGKNALERARSQNAVVTQMTFKAESSDNLWLKRMSLHYPGHDNFTEFVSALFLNRRIPADSDLVLDAFTSRFDVPMLRVTIAGKSADSRDALVKVIDQARSALPDEWNNDQMVVVETFQSSDIMKNIFSVGFGIPEDSEITTIREGLQVVSVTDSNTQEQNAYLGKVVTDIDKGIGFKNDNTGKIDKDLRLFKRLRINTLDEISSSGRAFISRGQKSTKLKTQPATAKPLPQDEGILDKFLGLLQFKPRIPGFKGHIYIPSDGFIYKENAYQYATSSFPIEDTSPYMVAYPLDEEDIVFAIKFAIENHKKVVARSGGHQYCGKSSGRSDTIVLSMDALNFINDLSENEVEVGPGVHLHQLANHFQDKGLTIPHGECPMVCIGGHAQTGGYGHLLRSFGLALDYVVELDIILADGQKKTVKRPNGPPQTDDEFLFWGVLGGNAGSFGIVTRYKFDCIVAGDYLDSFGYKAILRYDKAVFYQLMQETQAWTKAIVDETLPAGLDFMMSVESSFVSLLPPVLVVELLQKDAGPSDEPHLAKELVSIINRTEQAEEFDFPLVQAKTMGKDLLSNLSRSFVRDFPSTTWTGREFRFPYRKRLNCTSVALTDSFVTRFVDLLNRVVMRTDGDMDGIYLVFQMMFGGGELKDSKHRSETSIPRRDLVYAFVFDLFYDDKFKDKAVALQNEMKLLLNETGYSPDGDEKLFWGSFGDTKMSDPDVQKCYYDNAADYAKLQLLKKRVDSGGRFGSEFSVQLPVE